jgi:hypothetical protein
MKRHSREVQVWERRWVKYRLNTGIALSDNIPMDIIDRTPNRLSEIRSRSQIFVYVPRQIYSSNFV